MCKICNFIYCLNAVHVPEENGNGERIDAMGVLSTLTPEFIPGTFSFSVMFSVMNVDISTSNNKIQVAFFKEDKKEPLAQTDVINLPPISDQSNDDIPIEFRGLNMSLDFRNVIFEQEGVYKTKVCFNDELLGCFPIYVKGRRNII